MPAPASPLTDSRQLVRVLAADWNSPHAVLQRYTRTQAAAAWQPVGDALPVMLGRAGLAWGRVKRLPSFWWAFAAGAVTSAGFYAFNALLRIWLGPSPADAQLKDALLGIEPKGRPGR